MKTLIRILLWICLILLILLTSACTPYNPRIQNFNFYGVPTSQQKAIVKEIIAKDKDISKRFDTAH